MSDYLKSVRRGEPIDLSAAAWNKLMDMARRDGERGASGVADPLFARRDRDLVLLKNISGIEYPRWGVLGLGAPVYLPQHNPPSGKQELPQDFAENLVLKGEMPVAGVHEGLFGVLLQPLKDGEIGPAVVSGTFGCVIVVQDERHRFADVYPSRADLGSGESLSSGTPLVDGDVYLRSCDTVVRRFSGRSPASASATRRCVSRSSHARASEPFSASPTSCPANASAGATNGRRHGSTRTPEAPPTGATCRSSTGSRARTRWAPSQSRAWR